MASSAIQAAERRPVMAGAEGRAGIDLDGDAGRRMAPIMAAMDEKAPRLDRRQPRQCRAHPIDLRQRHRGKGCRIEPRHLEAMRQLAHPAAW